MRRGRGIESASERFTHRAERALAYPPSPRTSSSWQHWQEENRKKTGTVIVAVRFNGGVVIVADWQMTWGYSKIYDKRIEKVHKMSGFSAIGSSGDIADIQWFNVAFRSMLNYYTARIGGELPATTQVKILVHFLRYVVSQVGWICMYSIFAGYDAKKKLPVIFEVEGDGCAFERTDVGYATTGSGGWDATVVIQELIEGKNPVDFSESEAATIALRAVWRAGKRDPYVSDADVFPPLVAIIDEKGYRRMNENAVRETIGAFLLRHDAGKEKA